jgi:hypothetical protein
MKNKRGPRRDRKQFPYEAQEGAGRIHEAAHTVASPRTVCVSAVGVALPRLKADARRKKKPLRSREARTKHVNRPLLSRLIENVFHACLHRRGHVGRQLLRHTGETPGLFGECLCLFARMLRRQFNERGR